MTESTEDSYWATLVRLPRWDPDLRRRLIAAGVDPWRVPVGIVNSPVEVCMELFAASSAAAKTGIRSALGHWVSLMPDDFVVEPVPMSVPDDRFTERPPLI